MWCVDDSVTKQAIETAPEGVNTASFQYGTSGGNNYFKACNEALEAKPALRRNRSLEYNEAHVYAFGNWIALRQGPCCFHF